MEFSITGGHAYVENTADFLKRIRQVSLKNNTIIQAIDAGRIAGEDHILTAADKALRAFENNSNVAKDIGIEIMRYAAGRRQIEEAFSLGIHEGNMDLVFVILGRKEDVEASIAEIGSIIDIAPVMEYNDAKRADITSHFSITEKEIEAAGENMIPALVRERVALVDIMK